LRDPAVLYRASKFDCDACALKPEHASAQSSTLIHEAARDKARAIAETEAYVVSRRERKIVEMFFCPSQAYPQDRPIKASWSKWSQRWVPLGRHRPKSAETGEANPRFGADLGRMRRRGSTWLSSTATPSTNVVFQRNPPN